MIRLLKRADQVRVVADQFGTPTSAADLAQFLWTYSLSPNDERVIHWTNGGTASWFDFAVGIRDAALEKGIIRSKTEIRAIPSDEYPTKAARPRYSVLDSSLAWNATGPARDWREALDETLEKLASSAGID
jgi:dTDP-4-dehydrorhamnose reductase